MGRTGDVVAGARRLLELRTELLLFEALQPPYLVRSGIWPCRLGVDGDWAVAVGAGRIGRNLQPQRAAVIGQGEGGLEGDRRLTKSRNVFERNAGYCPSMIGLTSDEIAFVLALGDLGVGLRCLAERGSQVRVLLDELGHLSSLIKPGSAA